MTTPGPVVPPGIAGLVESARERAAVVGAFDPLRLASFVSDAHAAQQVLGHVAADCVEIESAVGFRWRMDPDPRRRTLAALAQAGRLRDVAREAEPEADDLFGREMRRALLEHESIATEQLSSAELDELHTALQFVAPVVGEAFPSVEVETALSRRDAEAALQLLLPTPLFGRDAELERISRFATDRAADARTVDAPPVLNLTGIGGAGKSALLAGVVRRLRGVRWDGAPVIWLDFDRAALAAADTAALVMEFSRQLALHRPAWAQPLSAFRRQVREQVADAGDPNVARFEAQASFSSTLWSLWRHHLRGVLPLDEPIVLILDTFEEIVLRGASEVAHVMRWLQSLQAEGLLLGLRVVLSGRALPQQQAEITLGDLDAGAARELLGDLLAASRLPLQHFRIGEIVDAFGGNPLALKLVARYLRGEGPAAASALLADRPPERFAGEFAQSFLYRRILDRVRTNDPDVVRLAHPGLALRRVTPMLIAEVLAAPCGLRNVDRVRAEALFDKLAGQVWLVERTADPRVVLHRRDLRRLMMQVIDASERDAALAIHRGAAAYYRAHRDATMNAREQDCESLYHGLFVDAAAALSSWERPAHELVAYLGEDVETLPLPARARLKFEAGRPLSEREEAALDSRARTEYARRIRRSAQSRGDVLRADADPAAEPTSFVASGAIEALYGAGAVRQLASLALQVADRFFDDAETGALFSANVEGGFLDSLLWRAAICVVGDERRGEFAQRVADRAADAGVEWGRRVNPAARSILTIGTAVAMVMALVGGPMPIPQELWASSRRASPIIEAVDQLRAWQLLGGSQGGRVEVRASLLCDLSDAVLGTLTRTPPAPPIVHLGAPESHRAMAKAAPVSPPTLAALSLPTTPAWTVIIGGMPEPGDLSRTVVHGCLRELHAAVRGALHQLDAGVLDDLAAAAAHHAAAWPLELRGEMLAAALRRDRERWTATLVDTADRFGLLLAFTALAARLAPGEAIGAVHRTCVAYDHVIRVFGRSPA